MLSFALVVLLIPLGSLYLFRLFEDELVLRTELELIAQSAALSAIYKEKVLLVEAKEGRRFGQKLEYLAPGNEYYRPVKPLLTLSGGAALPSRPDARPARQQADAPALAIGTELQPVLRDTQRVMLSGMRLLDWRGVVIGGTDEAGASLAHVPEVASAMQGHYAANVRERISNEPQPALSSISRGTRIRLFTAFPVLDGDRLLGIVYLSRTPENILRFLYNERQRVIWPTLVIVLLTLLLAVLIASRIVRPIKALIDQTERVAKDTDTILVPIDNPGTHELAQLSQSFAHMANALHERRRYIEEFASHVSHEFKSPLTAMQGALELLLDHPDMSAEQQQRFLNNLLSDTDRLKALVTGLLALARADNQPVMQEVSHLGPVLETLSEVYGRRGLELTVEDSLAGQRLNIAPEALKTLLGNLLSNSLEHGAQQVSMGIEAEKGGCICLFFQDDGEGISSANRGQIFTPFFTTRRQQGGTGLGLGIVQSLLKAYDGQIALVDSDKGARFLLTMKCCHFKG